MRACHALSTPTATSPASQALALASGIWQIRPGDDPTQGAWPAGACLPAFRAAVSVSTTSTTGNGGSESHPFLQRRACAAGQHSQRRELQTAQKPRARWRAVVGRQLGGSSAAKGLLTASMGVVEGRSHPGQRLVVRVRTPRRPQRACWGGGVRGPPQRWLAKGSAAAGKTRRAEGAMGVRSIATDFVDNAQELPEQRRCHHRGPLRALCARENQGSKTSRSYKHRLLGKGCTLRIIAAES